MDELHYIQMQILKELLYQPKFRFSDLNKSKIATDKFSYHLNKLLEIKFVAKEDNFYSLTLNGKKYAGTIDTKSNLIEKQPKSCVLIIPTKTLGTDQMFLIQQRRKEPYFGYWGFMTGKIRYGEQIYETAKRELEEEMGLAADFNFQYTLHEMVYNKQEMQLEDKFFYVIEATNLKGNLLQTEEGNNKWISLDEFQNLTPKYHNEDDILSWYLNQDLKFKEHKYFIDGF